jgi:hypothetical protein
MLLLTTKMSSKDLEQLLYSLDFSIKEETTYNSTGNTSVSVTQRKTPFHSSQIKKLASNRDETKEEVKIRRHRSSK